jgi:hypothetical protein
VAADETVRYRSGVTLPAECWEWLAEVCQRDGSRRDDLLEGIVLLAMDADEQKLRCTGLAASWCPVHGNCTCPVKESHLNDPGCPLHSSESTHAE